MRLNDYLDKGASLGIDRALPDHGRAHADLWRGAGLSWHDRPGFAPVGGPGRGKVAILSANDPIAFSCVFGISRAGAVWCPINPRNEAAENRDLLAAFDCTCLIYQSGIRALVDQILPDLPKLTTVVCLDAARPGCQSFDQWVDGLDRADEAGPVVAGAGEARWTGEAADDLAMIVGTGGTTGRPKGVMLTGRNLETMTALTLMGYPFRGRPDVPGAGAADPRRRSAVLPGAGQWRRSDHHAEAGPGRVPAARRKAPGDPHLPAADPDLHAARPSRPGRHESDLPAMLLVRRGADVGDPAGGGASPESGR